jgi:hypothetical protein
MEKSSATRRLVETSRNLIQIRRGLRFDELSRDTSAETQERTCRLVRRRDQINSRLRCYALPNFHRNDRPWP